MGVVRPGQLLAQHLESTPLSEVIADRDSDLVPDHIGKQFTVNGVAITYPHQAREGWYYIVIEDNTAGLRLLSEDPSTLQAIEPGRRVRARGVLHHRRGTEEFVADLVEKQEMVGAPVPREVLVADLLSEAHMHRLVRVEGTLTPQFNENNEIDVALLADRSGTIPVRVPTRFLSDPEFVELVRAVGRVTVVGVLGQSDRDGPPFDGGYRLQPRETWDVTWEMPPPYGTIAVSGLFGLLAVLVPLFWWRRRIAEERAQQLELLASDLARAGEALGRNERLYRELFHNDLISHFLADESGRVIQCNAAFCRLFGFESEDEVKKATQFRVWYSQEEGSEILQGLQSQGRLEVREIRARTVDGAELTVLLNLTRAGGPDDGGVELRGSLIDITERKVLERDLLRSQRTDAVKHFAGGVAHDLNNMLTAILGNADILLQTKQNESTQVRLEDIRHSAERSAQLTGQLLAVARKQVVRPVVLDVNDTIRDIAGMLQRLIGSAIELVTLLDEPVGRVKMDPAQIEQILMNLTLNARDAMPDGGKLVIQTHQAAEPAHSDLADLGGQWLVLDVSDNGEGMDPATLDRIYEPFFSTKKNGTGLGLASVYGIVDQCNGHIAVDSQEGHGTRVHIRFPCTDVAEEAPSITSPPRVPKHTTSGTILLAEDEPAVRSVMRFVLEQAGYTVVEGANGQEVLRIFEADPRRIDLLLTDLVMSLMGGKELTDRVIKVRPELPVIIVTGYTDDDGAREAISVAGRVFLKKPFHPEALVEKVEGAMEKAEP